MTTLAAPTITTIHFPYIANAEGDLFLEGDSCHYMEITRNLVIEYELTDQPTVVGKLDPELVPILKEGKRKFLGQLDPLSLEDFEWALQIGLYCRCQVVATPKTSVLPVMTLAKPDPSPTQ